VNNPTGYVFWRGTAEHPAAADPVATGLEGCGYEDTSAVPGQVYYYYRVVVFAGAGYFACDGANID